MGFCGACGKKADSNDKFCTSCGTPIKEAKISVLEEAGQVIKEEYKQSTTPPEAESSGGDHIGDKKKGGEWLEHTVEHILKFAGFQTQREASFVFNDKGGDAFKIDILAKYNNTELFVECKDHGELKMSEKIMYTLTGQLDDYRKRQPKPVVGILAMTTKDDGRNAGIRENLRRHNCFLWDGSFIEHLQNKMVELDQTGFRDYILNHLDIFEASATKDNLCDFMVKYSFFTIPPEEYIGKSFDIMNIIDDIRTKLPENIKLVNFVPNTVHSNDSISCYNVTVDFSMKLDRDEIQSIADSKRGLSDKMNRRKPEEIVGRDYRETILEILAETYGIDYEPKKKGKSSGITFEGQRLN